MNELLMVIRKQLASDDEILCVAGIAGAFSLLEIENEESSDTFFDFDQGNDLVFKPLYLFFVFV